MWRISNFISGILLSSTLLVFLVLSSAPASADVIDTITLTVPVSCTMTSTSDTAHTASIPNNTYQSDIGTTTFTTFCNDNNGHSIYAVGYSNNEHGDTNLLNTDGDTSSSIITGTATSGNTSNWAMKLVPVTGTFAPTIENGFDSYHVVPDTYTKVATFTSPTTIAAGSSFQSTYQIFVSGTQKAGTYVGKVKYTMVHPASEVPVEPVSCDAGKICYTPNASGITDTMGDQSASSNSEVALWAYNFLRPGYGFAGWNTEYDYSGTTYGPNETITTGDLSTGGLTLYAYWIPTAGSLQNWTGCSAMSIGDVTALTDTRDNNTYAIAKLADGKCWMIENLRLDDTPELTTTNTDNPSLPLTNTWYISSSNYSTPITSNHLSVTSNSWCQELYIDANISKCDNQSMLNTDNTTNPAASMSDTYANIVGYGNYYNWYSATAGNGAYNANTNNDSISGSICPIGWRLPRGGNKNNESNNEFWQLIVTNLNEGIVPANYPSSTQPYFNGYAEAGPVAKLIRTYPNNFIYSGIWSDSSALVRGTDGHYWSSTVYSNTYVYYLYLYSSYIYPGDFPSNKYLGKSIRCIIDP